VRVLVTGSRDWEDREAVDNALSTLMLTEAGMHDVTVVHGACGTGADRFASDWVRDAERFDNGVFQEPHPADWQQHGRSAGPRRNAEMVALGADVCLAFIRNSSRGATHCAELAEKAGIPVKRFTA
jgi:SLOG family YspA-like protein